MVEFAEPRALSDVGVGGARPGDIDGVQADPRDARTDPSAPTPIVAQRFDEPCLADEVPRLLLHEEARLETPVFAVESWSRDGVHLEEVLARAGNLLIARGAYRAAPDQRPRSTVTLRHGIRVIEERLPAQE